MLRNPHQRRAAKAARVQASLEPTAVHVPAPVHVDAAAPAADAVCVACSHTGALHAAAGAPYPCSAALCSCSAYASQAAMRGAFRALKLASVKLDAGNTSAPQSSDAAAPISTSVIQVAACGVFHGHVAGDFELNPEVFDNIIDNFESTQNQHVPVDYEHGTEQTDPSSSIYQRGAPAVGWIVALENRGDDGLWATVNWVDAQAVEWIRAGQYRYFSPAIVFGATHPVTGADIGAVLVSGGLVNRPFLDGMEPVAARADGTKRLNTPCGALQGPAVAASAGAQASTQPVALGALAGAYGVQPVKLSMQDTVRGDVLNTLRTVFELDDLCTEADIVAALELLASYIANPALAGGVAVVSIVDSLRWAFRVPRLTRSAAVVEQVIAYLQSTATAPADVDASGDVSPPTESSMPAAATAADKSKAKKMDDGAMAVERAMGAPADPGAGGAQPAEPAPQDTSSPDQQDKSQAQMSDHAALAAKHVALQEAHSQFKAKLAACMGMDEHEASEDQILEGLQGKLDELKKLQEGVEAQAKAAAEKDADEVAARMNVTDPGKRKALLTMRSTQPEMFTTLYGEHLAAKPAPAAAPAAQPTGTVTEADATVMSASVAGTPAAGVSVVKTPTEAAETAAKANAEVHEGALTLMKDPNSGFNTYAAALKEVSARRARATAAAK